MGAAAFICFGFLVKGAHIHYIHIFRVRKIRLPFFGSIVYMTTENTEELDTSWIEEEESLLQISQHVSQTLTKEPTKHIRIEYLYINRENCVVNKEHETADISEGLLLADRIDQRKHDYAFTEAVAFIVDIDINRLQAFTQWTVEDTSAFGSWMIPVSPDVPFFIKPTLPIFHTAHCIYVLFQLPPPDEPKSILKKTGASAATKRVRIGHTPSYAASQKGRHTRRNNT